MKNIMSEELCKKENILGQMETDIRNIKLSLEKHEEKFAKYDENVVTVPILMTMMERQTQSQTELSKTMSQMQTFMAETTITLTNLSSQQKETILSIDSMKSDNQKRMDTQDVKIDEINEKFKIDVFQIFKSTWIKLILAGGGVGAFYKAYDMFLRQ